MILDKMIRFWFYKMKNILVTGATGYLGRYLVQVIKKQGYWVPALAVKNKVSKFISVLNTHQMSDLNVIHAKLLFEEDLKNPAIDGSAEGMQLVSTLKEFGLVNHSIWIEKQKDL
jgi:NADPH:quinone reductase-like Zn-dependent oxidoreductase